VLAVVARSGLGKADKPSEIVRGSASRLPWAWDGLCFGVPFHQASPLGAWDIVNNVAPTTTTGLAWSRDNTGNPAADLGTTAYIQYPHHPVHDRPSLALTAHVRIKRNATQEDWGGMLCNPYNAAAAPWSTWSLSHYGGTTTGILAGLITNGSTDYLFGPTLDPFGSTEFVNIFMRWSDGAAPDMLIYGERARVINTGSGSSAKSGALGYAASMGIRINSSEDTAQQFVGVYSQAMVWSRALSTAEMKALSLDPFGWYSPRRETITLGSPFPVIGIGTVATVGLYANVAPVLSGSVPLSYDVTASPNADAVFTKTVSGVDTSTTVPAGTTQNVTTGAAAASDVTFMGLETDDSGV
jgi:hypothetical protein